MQKKLTAKNVKRAIIIIGVIIIPLLYSYFYLGAFWDPYSTLDTLPIAVVNNDKGASINDKERNLGQEMCDRLKEDGSLKFIFTDEADAKSGTEGTEYYAMLVIPDDFSADVASASTTEKHTATIKFSPNEKRNYLASQILSRAVLEIEETTRSSVNQELVQELADKLKSVPDQMTELSDGMNKLSDGAGKLKDGADTLKDGTATFDSKFSEYKNGVSTLKDGSSKVATGVTALDSGINDLLTGANTLAASTANIDALGTGAKSLADGAKTFNDSLTQYTAGVDSLISTVTGTSDFLTKYVTSVNPSIMKDQTFAAFISQMSKPENTQSIQTLKAASAQLKAASAQIAAGTAQLSDGTKSLPQLKAALTQLSDGLVKAKAGSAELAKGSQSLYDGVSTLSGATDQFGTAVKDIHSGADALSKGATDIKDGVTTAKTGIDDSLTDANTSIAALDGLSDFAKEPVNIEQENINPVPNYGTAFAPYFLSLSLWVGALIIFFGIYLDADSRFKILSRTSEHRMARSFIYLLIGFAQAIVLAIVVKLGLGLEVANMWLYLGSCCLVSMVFIAIVQFLLVHLKDIGKFLAILFLILQLTSCGGTFPMETLPKMFNVMYPFMPMTYSVGLFKQAISGVVTSETAFNTGILVAILVVFMGATVLLSLIKVKSANAATQD